MSQPFLIAAILSLTIAGIHSFAGSKSDVRPLLESNLSEPAKSKLYYCWHLVTIVLVFIAASFAWSGIQPQDHRTACPEWSAPY